MVPSMKAIGLMINSMDKAKKSGLMVLNMRETISSVKKTEMENSFGQTDPHMRDNSLTIIYMGMVNINGRMEESSQVTGYVTRCMARVFSHGLMEEDMKETIMMIRNKEMASSYGLTEDNMMARG